MSPEGRSARAEQDRGERINTGTFTLNVILVIALITGFIIGSLMYLDLKERAAKSGCAAYDDVGNFYWKSPSPK